MIKAERKAMNAYKEDLVKQGVEKTIAEAMAKAFIETRIIKPVVNSIK